MVIVPIPTEDETLRTYIRSGLGCGTLEDLVVLQESMMLPVILQAAENDPALRVALSTIYESSFTPDIWLKITKVLSLQCAAEDEANTPRL